MYLDKMSHLLVNDELDIEEKILDNFIGHKSSIS